jgi:hypothetical protein
MAAIKARAEPISRRISEFERRNSGIGFSLKIWIPAPTIVDTQEEL